MFFRVHLGRLGSLFKQDGIDQLHLQVLATQFIPDTDLHLIVLGIKGAVLPYLCQLVLDLAL